MEQIFHGKFSLYDAAIFLHKVSSFLYIYSLFVSFLPIICIKLSNY